MNAIKLLVAAVISLCLVNCKQSKKPGNEDLNDKAKNSANTDSEKMNKIMDSLVHFKKMQLTIDSTRSDVDELIPLGYNDNGSFAYFINENTGGASKVNFNISPVYEVFSVRCSFDMDMDLDSILSHHSAFIYQALLDGKIRLTNQFRKFSTDSMGVQYGFKFDNKKTYGPADPDDGTGKKQLTSVLISYRRYDEPTVDVVNKQIKAFETVL